MLFAASIRAGTEAGYEAALSAYVGAAVAHSNARAAMFAYDRANPGYTEGWLPMFRAVNIASAQQIDAERILVRARALKGGL